ncbi:MazF family transcriptional regulator [Candidatus Giovannonibacteria bacterium RIFCSPLOWO2_02_FULL_43_11b]|uniref:MazF family transcriptional regulator n=1 Tax=Candidatus Taylorbacteria bacterium RIFCSPHIGHO2_12_FULL_45_16 TaxID=1802315 RepID=A0A1G2MZY9_9BACT|nr:MAG: MazF family transcriptional regulator [Candidatus Giovannonibacteria bacterium RIFCSPHIGHO2_02_FULL_43_32]OGF78802.1 MAG: MazF family transcriptional regulator [Candidatus Giovannonibacteria bacterium RIFCSPLOWO2_01_FULL_43_60]OGF89512.1 MAG: MazF family transcriptional regulator [Candidatus Giovannonibacteria bacterium RIFCSPLOWO2_02_FULL_43_11b]OGF92375.1 MAG: MazF family transcriptional regulator [Candidatus Giovannonibacteria bacterium RIFCSPLOWO2_12_FULL_43_11c]OHA16368.1 MAG: MazF
MATKVQKWGNSLAVRLPREVAEKFKLGEGTTVEIKSEDYGIVIKPAKKQKYTLEELVAGITPENRHEETDWGKPMGREIW